VLNWLNAHYNRGRRGLGFMTKRTVYPMNRKYVGLPENMFVFIVVKRAIIDMFVLQEGMPWKGTWFI